MSDSLPNYKNSPTIRDIAHKANVSISTVSRVLNDHPHVDDETRQTVWKIASDLDYPLSKLRGNSPKASRSIIFLSHYQDDAPIPSDVKVAGIEQLVVLGAQSIFERKGVATYSFPK